MESSTKLWFKRLFFPGFNLGTRSRAIIRNYMLKEPDIRTLDLGCGNGFFTAMAVKRGGSALGVSFDPAQIDRCNEFKAHLGVDPAKLEFRVMNAVSILQIEEKFDQILFLEVIEHIDRDTEVMNNIARLLKPGGVLQLTTPDIRWGLWTGELDRFARGGHCRLGYSAYRLEEIVRAAGLDVSFQLKIGGLGNFLQPVQFFLIRLFGGKVVSEGSAAGGMAFLLLYPIFLILKLIPIPDSMRMVQYIQAQTHGGGRRLRGLIRPFVG